MARSYALAGALSGFVAVAAGALGAHALKAQLPPDLLQVFETGVRYQMYHAFGLLVVGLVMDNGNRRPARWAGRLFLAGTVLFSGSLYALSLTGITRFGLVTPLGGLALLGGWLCLAVAVRRR